MTTALLPSPANLGLPAHFDAWRIGQPEAILHAIDAEQRFTGLVMPTGFGKSLVYMAIAFLTGKRTVILTSTRALQRQLVQDFEALDATLVQGQRNYICRAVQPGGELHADFAPETPFDGNCDHGPCHLGVECSLHDQGCGYFDQVRLAYGARIIITNYAWWMSLLRNPLALNAIRPELLVCDEAHDSPDALAGAIGTTLSAQLVGQVLHEKLPTAGTFDSHGWIDWAHARVTRIQGMLTGTRPRTRQAIFGLRRAQTLLYALERIAAMDHSLLLVSGDLDELKFDVVWAATYSEGYLFRRTPKVVLTSATMTRHTADLLGVMDKELDLYEAGDGFPLKRRPVYVAPARKPPFGEPLNMDFRMDDDDEIAWLEHVDRILESRKDRNGIIHTVSYRRRDMIIARSAHRERMVTHGRNDAQEMISRFKGMQNRILVSPAVTTGYDFPYEECEFQIIAKIPFPDRRDPLTKQRTLIDSRYPNHIAMQQLVQAVGRGMRAEDDQCETFICDAHARWFLSKNMDLAPRWFRRAVRRHLDAGAIPVPPPPLGSRSRGGAASEGDTQ